MLSAGSRRSGSTTSNASCSWVLEAAEEICSRTANRRATSCPGLEGKEYIPGVLDIGAVHALPPLAGHRARVAAVDVRSPPGSTIPPPHHRHAPPRTKGRLHRRQSTPDVHALRSDAAMGPGSTHRQ